jgi:hypothetical protein
MNIDKVTILNNSKEVNNQSEKNNILFSNKYEDIKAKRSLTNKSIGNDKDKNKNNKLILKENFDESTKIDSKATISSKPKTNDKDKKIEEENSHSELSFSKSWNYDKRNFCHIFCDIFYDIFFIFKNSYKQLFPNSLIIIMLNISFHTFLFVNAFFFNDNYITDINLGKIKNNLEYIFVKETKRLIIVSFFNICIIRLLFWFFNEQEKLEEAEQLLDDGLQEKY